MQNFRDKEVTAVASGGHVPMRARKNIAGGRLCLEILHSQLVREKVYNCLLFFEVESIEVRIFEKQ